MACHPLAPARGIVFGIIISVVLFWAPLGLWLVSR